MGAGPAQLCCFVAWLQKPNLASTASNVFSTCCNKESLIIKLLQFFNPISKKSYKFYCEKCQPWHQ